MAGPPIFPAADDQRDATRDERRGAAVNRRTFDRRTFDRSGSLESVAEAQERYANLGLAPTTPLELRDSGYSPWTPRPAPPMDRHPEAEPEQLTAAKRVTPSEPMTAAERAEQQAAEGEL